MGNWSEFDIEIQIGGKQWSEFDIDVQVGGKLIPVQPICLVINNDNCGPVRTRTEA